MCSCRHSKRPALKTSAGTTCGTRSHRVWQWPVRHFRPLRNCWAIPRSRWRNGTRTCRPGICRRRCNGWCRKQPAPEPAPSPRVAKKANAPGGSRTPDPRLRRPLLYPTELLALVTCASQPALLCKIGVRGFEPPTPCAQGRCATRLRYTPLIPVGCLTRPPQAPRVQSAGNPRNRARLGNQSSVHGTRTSPAQPVRPRLFPPNVAGARGCWIPDSRRVTTFREDTTTMVWESARVARAARGSGSGSWCGCESESGSWCECESESG